MADQSYKWWTIGFLPGGTFTSLAASSSSMLESTGVAPAIAVWTSWRQSSATWASWRLRTNWPASSECRLDSLSPFDLETSQGRPSHLWFPLPWAGQEMRSGLGLTSRRHHALGILRLFGFQRRTQSVMEWPVWSDGIVRPMPRSASSCLLQTGRCFKGWGEILSHQRNNSKIRSSLKSFDFCAWRVIMMFVND